MSPPESTSPRLICRHCDDLHPSSFSHCPNSGRPLSSGRDLVGRVIAKRYKILAPIGEGGMGAVYVAEHLAVGRKVALKRLHPELAGDEASVARFQREARTAAAIGHEHIVEILDLGFGEDGAPFLVMEYLRGRSLRRALEDAAAESSPASGIEPARAARILGQVLAALGAVHERGIVHRDLKPDNILLVRRRGTTDFVKVVDFGVSKIRQEDEGGLSLTRTGVMLGTPFYMSPEQARGMKDLDHRVDLFAAGVILYESLSGRLPFEGENYHQLLQTILSGKHQRVESLRPSLDPALARIVEKAIALDPAARFQSAHEMLRALVPYGAVDPGPPPPTERTPSVDALPAFAEPRPSPVPDGLEDRTRPRLGASRASTPPPLGVAPEPRSTDGPARGFVAQSEDWRDSRPVAASGIGEMRGPYRSAPAMFTPPRSGTRKRVGRASAVDAPTPRPALAPSRDALGDTSDVASEIKASLVLSALDYLRAQGRVDDVLARAAPDVRDRLSGAMLPMASASLADYAALLRAAERVIRIGDAGASGAIGRFTADRDLTSTHRLFLAGATPTMAVGRIPQVFRTYHLGGTTEVSPGPAGSYRVTVADLSPDTLLHAMVFASFYQRLLELSGAHDVRASVVSCRERGDSSTATILRWR